MGNELTNTEGEGVVKGGRGEARSEGDKSNSLQGVVDWAVRAGVNFYRRRRRNFT